MTSQVDTKTTIVTGAPGWLGSRLVECLCSGLPEVPGLSEAQPRHIRVLKAVSQHHNPIKQVACEALVCPGDLRDAHSLEPLFENAQGATVFHIAGVIHPTHGIKEFFQVNVEGTRKIVELAKKARVKRLIYVSSNSPIGTNSSPHALFDERSPYNPYMSYGQSKMQAERIVNDAYSEGELETVIVRPPWFYGPGQPPRQNLFFTMIKNGNAPIVGDGTNLRSMAFIDNICQGLLLCEKVEQAKGNTYWIADRRPYTMLEIIGTVERLLEKEFGMAVAHKRMYLPKVASDVALAIDAALQACGLYHQKIHVLSEMSRSIACKIDKAEKELGYDPKIELEEGMRRSIRWVLDQGMKI